MLMNEIVAMISEFVLRKCKAAEKRKTVEGVVPPPIMYLYL